MGHKVKISSYALEKAKEFGFSGNVQKSLKNLVKFSAPYTHQLGNRRNREYILLIESDILKDINLIDDKKQRRRLKFGKKKRVCPDCNNDGDYGGFCLSCNSTGYQLK